MSTTAVCGEQHKFHHLLSSNNSTNNLPPRKLLPIRRAQEYSASDSDNMTDNSSPRFSAADEALLRKFLPYNSSTGADEDEDSDDPYSSDHFRMFEFKIRRCTRSRSHDWTDCPFAHPGEKARRRDPRRHHYSGAVCADYRRGSCGRGDSCEFAHGVFECWLHPARYRTEACKDGNNCKRKVCFFAHTPRQLRVLPAKSSSQDHHYQHPNNNNSNNKNKYQLGQLNKHKHCCFFCHPASSPTSTLHLGGHFSSPPMSPPLSPSNKQQHCASANGAGFHSSNSPLSRYTSSTSATGNCRHSQQYYLLSAAAGSGGLNHDDDDQMMSYEDVLAELMTSLEAMKFKTNNNICKLADYSSPCSVLPNDIGSPRPNAQPTRWADISSINSTIHNAANADNAGGYDHGQDLDLLDQQQQFVAAAAAAKGGAKGGEGPGNYFSTSSTNTGHGQEEEEEDHQLYYYCSPPDDEHKQRINHQVNFNFNSPTDPDLGWVNDLLM